MSLDAAHRSHRHERARRLAGVRALLWVESSLAVAIVFISLVAFNSGASDVVWPLFWIELVLMVPLSWVLVTLLERTAGTALTVVAVVFASVIEAVLVVQLIYTATRISKCKGMPAEPACTYPHQDFRVVALVIVCVYLVVNTLMIAATARFCVLQRREIGKVRQSERRPLPQEEEGDYDSDNNVVDADPRDILKEEELPPPPPQRPARKNAGASALLQSVMK